MARSAASTVENNFSRGLITEATAMNYPENSVIETDNSIYLVNGTVLRRNGIDLETDSIYTFADLDVLENSIDPDYGSVAVGEYEWVTLSDDGNKVFLVVQVGDVLRFFEVDDDNIASSHLKSFKVNIGDYRTTPVLSTDIASVTGSVTVNDALIAGLTGTLTVTVDGTTETITFPDETVDTDPPNMVYDLSMNTLAEFEAALDTLAVNLGIVAEIDGSNHLHFSALENDVATSFTVGGTIDVATAFGIVETTYDPDTEDVYEAVARRRCSFSSGLGYLFVVHPYCEPFFVEYDLDTDTITTTQIEVETRDFERLEDSLRIDERPNSLVKEHRYNLWNQGWYASGVSGSSGNVAVTWEASKGVWPSNTDIWWLWKNSSESFAPGTTTFAQLSSPAPNGHYIFNAFQTDRRNATGTVLADIEEKSSGPSRPSVNAFFASRVWYSGINEKGFGPNIYFSKIIEGKKDFGICYQLQDPTAEDLPDLQEIDGGLIVIPDIVRVTGLLPIGRSLLVFATNGVWTISGSNGGFKANDYSIQKISTSPVDAPSSVVIAGSQPFWWGRDGIYTVIIDPNSGELTVENISDITIKKLVTSIPADNVPFIKGVYNSLDKTIQWSYRLTAYEDEIEKYQYTHLLIHNTGTKSFAPFSISDSVIRVSGAIHTTKSSYDALAEDPSGSSSIFLVTGNFGTGDAPALSMAKFKDTNFVDWYSLDDEGVDFESYFITGYRVRAELLRKFQSNYLVVMCSVDTDTFDDYGCLMQSLWDYNNSEEGRLTREQQVYKFSYNQDYSRRKLKVRGNGYSLQFKFKSQSGKKFLINGWVSSETASNVP